MPTLTWIGKSAVIDHHTHVPIHLLVEQPERGAGDPASDNLLIEGDNLLALKALLPRYAGQIQALQGAFPHGADRTAVQRLIERVNRSSDRRTPSQRRALFAVPLLIYRQGALVEPFEEVHLLERLPASVQDCSPLLTAAEYAPANPKVQTGVIDISTGGHVQAASFVGDLHRQMTYLDADRA